MMKLVWSMILSGSALVAYPHLTKDPLYHASFPETAIDAIEYPQSVKVLLLKPNQDRRSLQAYAFNTTVDREYNVPSGWSDGFKSTLNKFTNQKKGATPESTSGQPDMVIRYEGRSTTVDLIVSSKTGSMWFLERGKLRPFYSRSFATDRQDVVTSIRAAIPHTVVKNFN